MRANNRGDLVSGVGDNQITLWLIDELAARPIGRGGAAGWLSDDELLGAGPNLVSALRVDNWALEPFLLAPTYQPNDSYAGGLDKWIASRAAENNLVGTVPPGYEAWKAHDVGPDGTVVLVLNGVYTVFFPDGASPHTFYASQVRATGAGIVAVGASGFLSIATNNEFFNPAQLSPMKWWATSVGEEWLLYLCDGYGLVLHSIHDASQGYQWNVAPYSPCGVTLADGRTLIAWSSGAAEQAADLVRVFVTLGVNMQPLRPLTAPPIDPEPPIDPPVPPVDPPIDPEPPNPEPEPMPRPEPKDRRDMERRAAHAFMKNIGGVSVEDAIQGVLQVGDRIASHPGLYWDAYDLAIGAATRDGGPSVTMEATKLDALAKDCEVINTECLQRR